MRARSGRLGRAVVTCLLSVALAACGAKNAEEPPPGLSNVPTRTVAAYAFESLDNRPVSAAAFAGRPTVLAFVATWDLLSQAQVRFLVEMDKHDQGKVAYALVFVQETKDRELIDVYKSTLNVTLPSAIAPQTSLAGGPFADIQSVPTLVVLDGGGHVRFQKVGLAKSDEIRAAIGGL